MRRAFARFLCWLRSSRQTTTVPVGRWVIRTALAVLFWCWPPGPPAVMVSTSRSSGRIVISTSSGSESTATVAAEVWMRPWVSVSGTRLDPVPAGLELQMPERPVAAHPEAGLAEPAKLGGDEFQGLELPAHDLGVPAVHLHEVSGEQGGLVAAGSGADLHDEPRPIGPGLLVVDQVAEVVAGLGLLRFQGLKLGLGVPSHLGVGLGVEQFGSLGDLAAEVEVARVGDRDLRQRAPLLGHRRRHVGGRTRLPGRAARPRSPGIAGNRPGASRTRDTGLHGDDRKEGGQHAKLCFIPVRGGGM